MPQHQSRQPTGHKTCIGETRVVESAEKVVIANSILDSNQQNSARLQHAENLSKELLLDFTRRSRCIPLSDPFENTVNDNEIERIVVKWKFRGGALNELYIKEVFLPKPDAGDL